MQILEIAVLPARLQARAARGKLKYEPVRESEEGRAKQQLLESFSAGEREIWIVKLIENYSAISSRD